MNVVSLSESPGHVMKTCRKTYVQYWNLDNNPHGIYSLQQMIQHLLTIFPQADTFLKITEFSYLLKTKSAEFIEKWATQVVINPLHPLQKLPPNLKITCH